VRKPVSTKKATLQKKKQRQPGRYATIKEAIYEYSVSGNPDDQMIDHIVDAVFNNENKMNELKTILDLSSLSPNIKTYEKILFRNFLQAHIWEYKDFESMFDHRTVRIVFSDPSDVKEFFMMQYFDMCHDFPELKSPGKILESFDIFFKKGVWPWIERMNTPQRQRLPELLRDILNPSIGAFLTGMYTGSDFGRRNWESKVYENLLGNPEFKIRIPDGHIFSESQKPTGTTDMKMILDMSSSGHLRVIYHQFASMLPLCLLVDAGQHFLPENNTVNHMWNAYLKYVGKDNVNNRSNIDRERIAQDLLDMLADRLIDNKLEGMRLHWWKSRSNNNSSNLANRNNNNRMNNSNSRINQAIKLRDELIDYIIRYGDAKQTARGKKLRYPYNPWEALGFLKVLKESNANNYQTIDDIRRLINRHKIENVLQNNNNNNIKKKYFIDVQPFSYSIWFRRPDGVEIRLHDIFLETFNPFCGTRPSSRAYYTSLTINSDHVCNTIKSIPLVKGDIVPGLDGPRMYATLLQKHLGDFIPILYSLVHQGYIYGTGDKMAATSYLIMHKFLKKPITYTYMDMFTNRNRRVVQHSGGRDLDRKYFVRKMFVEGRGNKDTFYISDIMNERYMRKSRRLDTSSRNGNIRRELDRLQEILDARRRLAARAANQSR